MGGCPYNVSHLFCLFFIFYQYRKYRSFVSCCLRSSCYILLRCLYSGIVDECRHFQAVSAHPRGGGRGRGGEGGQRAVPRVLYVCRSRASCIVSDLSRCCREVAPPASPPWACSLFLCMPSAIAVKRAPASVFCTA